MSLERGLAANLTADVLGYRRLTRDVDLIDQGPLWVRSRSSDDPAPMSTVGRKADMIR